MSKMIKLTSELRDYIISAMGSERGALSTFAEKIDVTHTTVRDWKSGKAKSIQKDVFLRLIKKLRGHMPMERYHKFIAEYGVPDIKTETLFPDFPGDHNQLDDILITIYLNSPENKELREKIPPSAPVLASKCQN